jgi:hypothetical protein
MAEILGPLSFCLAGLSFIFGTVPAAAKAIHNFCERKQQIQECEYRFVACQRQFEKWEEYWHTSAVERQSVHLAPSIGDVRRLETVIDNAIEKHTNVTEEDAWQQMKNNLRLGKFRLPQAKTPDFCKDLRHALWKKEILEGWITRLEKIISVAKESFEEEYHQQTAGFSKGSVYTQDWDDLEHLKRHFGKLNSMATELYHECMGTCELGTREWTLDLRPPALGRSIADWKIPTPVNIEMRFGVRDPRHGVAHHHLQTSFQIDNAVTHATSGWINLLVASKVSDTDNLPLEMVPIGVECHTYHVATRRTISVSKMLRDMPQLMTQMPWLLHRPDLIYGVAEWALLLWNSPWFEQLCCCGLAFEADGCSPNYTMHVLEMQPNHAGECQTQNADSRLRSLGLVFVQTILGVPIRLADGDNLSKYERWVRGTWEPFYLSNINAEILKITSSLFVQAAIYFCLRPDPELPDGEFRLGFLYMCIDRIFEPLVSHLVLSQHWLTD